MLLWLKLFIKCLFICDVGLGRYIEKVRFSFSLLDRR